MFVLEKFLDEEELQQVMEIYSTHILIKLNEKNMLNIIHYLIQNKIIYWRDILISYLDLFLIDSMEFISKFELLRKNYGIEFMGENLNILEKLAN
ncbi:MAG: hypothetical protein HFH86_03965 [Bacilli bacterium]|jgi:hypothetical protein|nr:hypothetical protein [Bacilli bacterium]